MKRHLTRLGMGLLAIGVMLFFCFLFIGFCALCMGTWYLFWAFPVLLKWILVTAAVLTFCYFVGKDMEDKKP